MIYAPQSTPSTELMALLRDLYTGEEIEKWLSSPQPLLAGATARDMIAAGRERELILVLRRLVDGVYV